MRFAETSDFETPANIAPLLDVVLLLLIFFMVTTSFAEQQIELDLPRAETGAAGTDEAVVLSVQPGGAYSVDNKMLDPQALSDLLRTIALQERNLEIRADAATRHEYVVKILDLARRMNVRRVGIAVDVE